MEMFTNQVKKKDLLLYIKEISNLNFDINDIINMLQSELVDIIESNPVKYYSIEYDNQKLKNSEALYLINIHNVIKQLIKWYQHLPYIVPFYAVKCNPDPIIIKLFAKLGISFDCASIKEIKQVLNDMKINSVNTEKSTSTSSTSSNFSTSSTSSNDIYITERIIYANPCKIISHLIESQILNVRMMTLDCIEELHKIHTYFPNAELIIRIAVDDSNSVCKFSSKFGCGNTDAQKIMNRAKELGMNVIGISFHVGSGCKSVESYKSAIKLAAELFDYGKSISFSMYLLDIGGGFPGTDPDSSESTYISFEEIAQGINIAIKTYFTKYASELKVIAEPGRFMVSSSHTLLLNVIGKKKKYLPSGEECYSYYINDGVYGSFNCIYFDHFEPKIKLIDTNKSSDDIVKHKSLIFGPTCDSMDVLFKVESYDDFDKKLTKLPELEIGDWLYVENFGAYTISAGCEFNGIPRPRKIYLWHNH
jgi:ornithine decarboxylase